MQRVHVRLERWRVRFHRISLFNKITVGVSMVAALNLKRRVSSKKSSASSRLLGKEKVSSKVLIRRAARLRAKRTAFFSLPIDYIPCRQFLRLDAEKLASTPPVNGEGPHHIARSGKGEENSSTPYLSKLYRTRLLTKDEEQFYFRRLNWLKFRAATSRGQLDERRATRDQMKKVEKLLQEAARAKNLIVTSNLRLVVSIAKKFIDPTNSFEELVSDGNVSLMRAVEKFNFALGNRFSTYATYAIQRNFFRLSHKGRQLRTRFVSDDESLRSVAVREPATKDLTPPQSAMLKATFSKFLGELEPREKEIIVARFGFHGMPARTFRELGIDMGVCKERIRQIQSRAMEKLREMALSDHLEQKVGDWI